MMFELLRARLRQGTRTSSFPEIVAEFPERFRGLPVLQPSHPIAGGLSSDLPPSAMLTTTDAGRPAVDVGECIVFQRPRTLIIIVRKKFGLVGCHIDRDWAIALASFAGEAKIERRFDVLVAPSVANDIALHHFP